MATFVGEDPDASHDHAGNDGVAGPSEESKVWVREERDVGCREVYKGTEVEVVAGHVGH